jgi:uncharacterized protein (TIGR03067 family)
VTLLGGLGVAADVTRIDTAIDNPTGDQDCLQGTWKIIRAQEDGKDRDIEEAKKVLVYVKGDRLLIHDDGKEKESYRFKVNPAAHPKTIDILQAEEKNNKVEVVGIYKTDGDTWTIVFLTDSDKKRPGSFKDEKLSMLVLQRQRR